MKLAGIRVDIYHGEIQERNLCFVRVRIGMSTASRTMNSVLISKPPIISFVVYLEIINIIKLLY